MMLRLAIIGMGWAGERQAQAIRELGRKVTIEAIVDNDPVFLRQKAGELGVEKTYPDYQVALNDPDVQAVSICTPHAFHCPMALAAAAAGKHILCEKPLAMNVADATRMIDAADAKGVKLYVAENWSYAPIAQFLRRVVETEAYIGEITAVSVVSGFQAKNFSYPGRRAWLTLPEQGGTGTWMLQGIHTMAQMRYIFGEVATVYMREHHASSFLRPDIEGTMSGLLTLESSVNVSVLHTCEVGLKNRLGGYTIHGDRGSIHAHRDGCDVYHAANGSRPEFVAYPPAELSDYALEIEAFADYVLDGVVGPTTGRSERRTLAIVQAGYESVQTGQPVNLKQRFGEL
jgi:predicted dehydrogenase